MISIQTVNKGAELVSIKFNDIEKILYPESGTKEIRQITFQITENCCLACTYCY